MQGSAGKCCPNTLVAAMVAWHRETVIDKDTQLVGSRTNVLNFEQQQQQPPITSKAQATPSHQTDNKVTYINTNQATSNPITTESKPTGRGGKVFAGAHCALRGNRKRAGVETRTFRCFTCAVANFLQVRRFHCCSRLPNTQKAAKHVEEQGARNKEQGARQ